jgi:hypothetical protein
MIYQLLISARIAPAACRHVLPNVTPSDASIIASAFWGAVKAEAENSLL